MTSGRVEEGREDHDSSCSSCITSRSKKQELAILKQKLHIYPQLVPTITIASSSLYSIKQKHARILVSCKNLLIRLISIVIMQMNGEDSIVIAMLLCSSWFVYQQLFLSWCSSSDFYSGIANRNDRKQRQRHWQVKSKNHVATFLAMFLFNHPSYCYGHTT